MAKISGVGVGESLVGDGNEVAHVDLLIGPRGSAVETAFCNALTNNKDGFTTLLAVIAPNLLTKPPTILYNKVTIKDARQAVQMFGPAQYAVAKAVADSVAEGVIPANEADDLYITVGVFIHWEAKAVEASLGSQASEQVRNRDLMAFDQSLKARGLNPGTSADLTVATLFAASVQALELRG